eukprot:gene5408-biopygen1716
MDLPFMKSELPLDPAATAAAAEREAAAAAGPLGSRSATGSTGSAKNGWGSDEWGSPASASNTGSTPCPPLPVVALSSSVSPSSLCRRCPLYLLWFCRLLPSVALSPLSFVAARSCSVSLMS